MKKILSIATVLMILILAGAVPAMAEDTPVDYNSLTNRELLDLIKQGQDKSKQLSEEINDLREAFALKIRQFDFLNNEYVKAYGAAESEITKAKENAKAADDTAATELEAAEKDVKAAEEAVLADPDDAEAAGKLEEARKSLADAQSKKEKSADLLQRANALSMDGAKSQGITDPDFSYLNEYVQKAKDAEVSRSEIKLEADAKQQAILEKTREQEAVNEQTHQLMTLYQNRTASKEEENKSNNIDPVPVPVPAVGTESEIPESPQAKKESESKRYAGVRTGDANDIVLPVAGFLAAAALFAVTIILKKKHGA